MEYQQYVTEELDKAKIQAEDLDTEWIEHIDVWEKIKSIIK